MPVQERRKALLDDGEVFGEAETLTADHFLGAGIEGINGQGRGP
jgi:hypothetical protein